MGVHKGLFALCMLIFLWLGGKYLLPFLFPFLLGTALALAAEPVTAFTARRLPRGLASGLGVSLTLLLIAAIATILGALAVKELGNLAVHVPNTVAQSADVLLNWLTELSAKAPGPVGPMLTASVERFFRQSDALTDRAVQQLPGMLSGFLEWMPGKAMSLGTGILSGYFISARLPKLRSAVQTQLPPLFTDTLLPALRKLRSALGKWLMAQGKLMAVTYGIVTVGLLVLGVRYAPAWALLVAAVDAVPLLGTGTVLVPWALVSFLRADPMLGFGLLILYAIAAVTRTVLEPRFFGKHLGLDPLVMLVFLYFGYRLWGFWGIVISPLLAAATKVLTEPMDNG